MRFQVFPPTYYNVNKMVAIEAHLLLSLLAKSQQSGVANTEVKFPVGFEFRIDWGREDYFETFMVYNSIC